MTKVSTITNKATTSSLSFLDFDSNLSISRLKLYIITLTFTSLPTSTCGSNVYIWSWSHSHIKLPLRTLIWILKLHLQYIDSYLVYWTCDPNLILRTSSYFVPTKVWNKEGKKNHLNWVMRVYSHNSIMNHFFLRLLTLPECKHDERSDSHPFGLITHTRIKHAFINTTW